MLLMAQFWVYSFLHLYQWFIKRIKDQCKPVCGWHIYVYKDKNKFASAFNNYFFLTSKRDLNWEMLFNSAYNKLPHEVLFSKKRKYQFIQSSALIKFRWRQHFMKNILAYFSMKNLLLYIIMTTLFAKLIKV